MITNQCYTQLAVFFHSELQNGRGLAIAIGSGETSWDQEPVMSQRDVTALSNEIVRKSVSVDNVSYLDSDNTQIDTPTPHILLQVNFEPGEGEGTIRECGLILDGYGQAGSGTLLSYFRHPRIEKNPDLALLRSIHIDFTPRSSGPGQIETRYLGNSNSRELHDLENETGACRIEGIRRDNRIYFGSPEQAVEMGYDFCAFCFGRELSQR